MMKDKIGLITFHNYNYGSALQCYASQEYLKSMGYEVFVIDIDIKKSVFARYALAAWHLFYLCLLHPRYIKQILSIYSSQRRKSLRITVESELCINEFNDDSLNCISYTLKELKRISKSDEFFVFLSGSDQVWNANRIDQYDLYFLRFAPKNKRYSWSSSFGGNIIAPYNIKRYARYINDFKSISVRETSAVNIIKQLTNRNAVCLADPVVLLTNNKWRKLYKTNATEFERHKDYILCFFLDKISDKALRAAEKLSKITGHQLLTFGYKQSEIQNHVDGGPCFFLSIIDDSDYVITDSFHATVFALLFHKKFYVFDRQYVHKQSQSSRIIDLLALVNMSDRYNPTQVDNGDLNYALVDKAFDSYRKEYESYTKQIFSTTYENNNIKKGI